jgi:hypothetical protein
MLFNICLYMVLDFNDNEIYDWCYLMYVYVHVLHWQLKLA